MPGVIDGMFQEMAAWLSKDGEDSDIVISSRARLARNLLSFPFVERSSDDQLKTVLANVLKAVENTKILGKACFFDVSALEELDRQFFAERRLISTDFIEMDNPRGLLVTKDEGSSIMINEEDHLRIQNICAGFALDETWQNVHRMDEELSRNLTYAFTDRFGYLTACPTNVGTGVRFSVFVHLPVLTFTKQIEDVFKETIPAGIAVRGFYGEGSKVIGNFFQISNQYTLGWTEQGILDRVKPLIERFISRERKAREKAIRDERVLIEDKIYRALGLISHNATTSTSSVWTKFRTMFGPQYP